MIAKRHDSRSQLTAVLPKSPARLAGLASLILGAACGGDDTSDDALPGDAAVQIDAGEPPVDAGADAPDAAPLVPDAGPALGPPAEQVELPGLAVRDIAIAGDKLVALVNNAQGKLDMVACPAAGCAVGLPPVVLAANQPVATFAIETDGARAYWATETALVQVGLDGQGRSDRFTVLGGKIAPVLLREQEFVHFAAWDAGNDTTSLRRVDTNASTGTTVVSGLLPSGLGLATVYVGGGTGSVAVWADPIGAAAETPIRVKPVAGGEVGTTVSIDRVARVNAIATAADGVFWVEEPSGNSPDVLRGCRTEGGCVPSDMAVGVVSALGSDGTTIFFAGIVDQQPVLYSCVAGIALNAGECEKTVLSADLCWLGARRLRVTLSHVYGVSQSGEVCRIAR